jgi:hypothetical protein
MRFVDENARLKRSLQAGSAWSVDDLIVESFVVVTSLVVVVTTLHKALKRIGARFAVSS